MTGRSQLNKPHKTRFSSKSSRNLHKTVKDKHQITKNERKSDKRGKATRRQQNKMIRDKKNAAVVNEKRALNSTNSPPRVIVLFGLSPQVDLNSLEKDLVSVLSPTKCSDDVFPTVVSSEYRIRATVLKAPHGDLSSCMEMAKVADLIAFVVSASSPYEGSSSDYVDAFGEQCLSVFKSLGMPNFAVLIRDLPGDLKRRHEAKKFCISGLASDFPDGCKFHVADTKDELHKFMWLYKEQTLTTPRWRTQRPYVATQKVEMLDHDYASGKCSLVLTGYVRARSLSVNQLVHVAGAGDYQLSKIEILRDPYALNPRKGQDAMDADEDDVEVTRSLMPDNLKQEPLLSENIPDPLAGEQTWPTMDEMAEAEEERKQRKLKKRKLPSGTSEYQAAWILDESDEDDLGSIDGGDDGMVLDEGYDGVTSNDISSKFDLDEDQRSLNLGDSDAETETDSVMVDGENLSREQIENEIRRLKEAHAEDEEFPDEVDAPLDVPARKRFAKYRGLKSLRTSSWDPKESLPPEYARIFAFDNFARTQKHVHAKALELDSDGRDDTATPGTYARLYVKEVLITVASKLCMSAKTIPIISCGLLQHESKMSVLHFSVRKHDSYTEPIKGKEEMIFHVGFRQFVARPIFSSDNNNSDKHKMERFLHAGSFSVASVYAPISFRPLPLIAMKKTGDAGSYVVAAVGSLSSVDPDRINLKRIVLTGYPQRVSKVKAVVRYMFHNPEDVRWFKPVEVWSKCGRRGRITEPVGTHGAMKCLLNGVLQQSDTVCLSLFKRAYPKWTEQKFPLLLN